MTESKFDIPTPNRRSPCGVVLVIEDHDPQRRAIQRALEVRGFEVLCARTAQEAIQVVRERATHIDVAVCDMLLEDSLPNKTAADGGPRLNKTGADLAELLATTTARFPTEIIFFTGHGKEEFFHAALRAQAAVYLKKGDTALPDLLRHVRILTLRRRLREQDALVQRALEDICRRSRNIESAVRSLWKRLWLPLLERYTDMQFAAIAQFEGRDPELIGGSLDVPTRALEVLGSVRTLLFAQPDRERFVRLEERVWASWSRQAAALPESLRGAVTVPLFSVTHCLLLLTKGRNNGQREVSDELEVADLLDRYLRVVAMNHLTRIARGLAETQRKKEILHLTARMCYSISHRQSDIVRAWKDLHETSGLTTWSSGSPAAPSAPNRTDGAVGASPAPLNRLEDLSLVLQNSAALLEGLVPNERHQSRCPAESEQLLSGAGLVWASLDNVRKADQPRLTIDVQGDCAVWGDESDYIDVLSTLLQWMAGRATGWGGDGQVRVECRVDRDKSTIRLCDRSRAVHERVRQDLFEPFGSTVSVRDPRRTHEGATSDLDLYVAKMIVELRLGGTISYVTPPGHEEGNCFEVRFPAGTTTFDP